MMQRLAAYLFQSAVPSMSHCSVSFPGAVLTPSGERVIVSPAGPWLQQMVASPVAPAGRCKIRKHYHLVMTNGLPWKDPPVLMGKSTISMAIFNSYILLVYQRVEGFYLSICSMIAIPESFPGSGKANNSGNKTVF